VNEFIDLITEIDFPFVTIGLLRGRKKFIDFQFKNKKGIADFKDMIYIPKRKIIQLYSKDAILMYFGAPTDIDTLIFTY